MKILVAGDVEGNFKQLFTRVQSILRKSGDFEPCSQSSPESEVDMGSDLLQMLLCVGSFFSSGSECEEKWKEYVEGRETVPIATYILGPCTTEHAQFFEGVGPDGGELCTNVTCLGQRGVYMTSSGLQIAYLSGVSERDSSKKGDDKTLHPYYTEQDLDGIRSYSRKEGFKGVDILLTSDWPKRVERFTTPPEGLDMKQIGAEPISQLALILKPRYHFAGRHHRFYERIPYRNHQVLGGSQQHVTRFLGLAHVGNPDKKNRYLYAFSIAPLTTMDPKELTQQPPAITNCPYTKSTVKEDLPDQNFFFDPKALAAGKKRKQQQQGAGAPQSKRPPLLSDPSRRPPAPRGPCWFCLGSPEVEKHLVVTIGDNSYLALPKGGLVKEHMLILPIGHYAASTDAPQDVLEEMKKFRISLRRYFQSKKQSCVIFERNFKSHHLQHQVIPVPQTPSGALRQAFIDHGKGQGIEMTEIPHDSILTDFAPPGAPYFTAEFDDGPSLFARIRGRFPLQFGREVLASPLVLNTPHRVDWKACSASKDEETETARTMRTKFQPFDFTAD